MSLGATYLSRTLENDKVEIAFIIRAVKVDSLSEIDRLMGH